MVQAVPVGRLVPIITEQLVIVLLLAQLLLLAVATVAALVAQPMGERAVLEVADEMVGLAGQGHLVKAIPEVVLLVLVKLVLEAAAERVRLAWLALPLLAAETVELELFLLLAEAPFNTLGVAVAVPNHLVAQFLSLGGWALPEAEMAEVLMLGPLYTTPLKLD